MKLDNTKYGILTITPTTALCTMENGGDKDGKAAYRFSDTDKRVSKNTYVLICDTNSMQDLYGATWYKTKYGWVKGEDKITWHSSYKAAKNAYNDLTDKKGRTIRIILICILAFLVAYLTYKLIKDRINPDAYEIPMEA